MCLILSLFKCNCSDDYRGKIQSQDSEISTDPDPLNTFSAVSQNFIYCTRISALEINKFD